MSEQKQSRRRKPPVKEKPKLAAPEIVYTQPKPFQRSVLIWRLVTVFAVVMAIFLSISVFFKVDTVEVAGARQYSADTIWEASGIEKGESLLFLGRAGATSRILQELPYVKSVRFGIKLPGTVMIIVEEIDVVYAIKAVDESWWLISADGKITERADAAAASKCTQITGVKLEDPQLGQRAVAFQEPQDPADTNPAVVLASDRLQAALSIAVQLEANEILGKVTSIDVQDLHKLQMWYGKSFCVKLGDTQQMDYKIAAVKQAVQQLGENRTGTLDASFTTYPDRVWCGPLKED